jgi:ApbE superfamily uncharacterized protein (UPF0280 family)
MLPDRRRVHMSDGPIDLILEADGSPQVIRPAYEAAARRFATILDELCSELALLRSRCTRFSKQPARPIARIMAAAVSPYRERHFITPMAAVAGAVAEAVLAEMTRAASLDRAYVNNGGDVALHLSEGHRYKLGMIERPDSSLLFGSVEVSAESSVRGVATSGWRGRSFSLGIADAVTVLAATAAQADAAATIIANAVDLPGHPAITHVPANEIEPDSDLGAIPVTRNVGPLADHEVDRALQNGVRVAKELQACSLIHAAALCLQSEVRVVTDRFAGARFSGDGVSTPSPASRQSQPNPRRSAQHA